MAESYNQRKVRELILAAGFPTASVNLNFRQCPLTVRELLEIWQKNASATKSKKIYFYDPPLQYLDD